MSFSALSRPLARRDGRRILSLLVAGLSLIALLVLVPASPAQAHATLVDSDPAEGAVLTAAPEEISLTFSESIALAPGGVQVYDATGETVASSAGTDGATLSVVLEEAVGDGTLIVSWRVVSGDGHPISGAHIFSIGEPSAQIVSVPTDAATGSPWTLSLTRWLGYLSLLLSAGLVVFLALLLPPARDADRSRARITRVMRWSAAVTVVSWMLAVPFTAMYQFGGGLEILADGDTWAAVAAAEYAVSATVVLGTILAATLAGRPPWAGIHRYAAVAAALLALGAPAFTGHTRAASPELLAISADILHLVAGGVWLGGLVALALALPDLASRRGPLAAQVLARFSTVAAGVVVALVITGTVLAWRIAGSWAVLFDSPYGWLLLAKIGVALTAVLIAAANRFLVLPQIIEASRQKEKRAGVAILTRYIVAEAAALVLVLLLTGFLVETSPQQSESASNAGVASEIISLGPLEARVAVEPAMEGPATVSVELFDAAGAPAEGMDTPRLRLSSGEIDLGSIEMTSRAPGTYSATVVLPAAGSWKAEVSLLVGEADNPVGVVEFDVSPRD